MKIITSFVLLSILGVSQSFVPAEILSSVLFKLEGRFRGNLGRVSDSYTHDEITKEGLIQSVVKYFYEQPGGSKKINLTKMNDYYDLRKLYFDYYGKGLCNDNIPLYGLIEDSITGFKASVASVDFSSATKDLPFAHFDAEFFKESNERVIEYKRQIAYSLKYNDFEDARTKSGKILHTIQDFYSHSNWIERGQRSIVTTIGSAAFDQLPTSKFRDNPCTDDKNSRSSGCTLIEEECGFWATLFATLINKLNLAGSYVQCPLKYFNCTDNILILDALVSGYYTGSELQDGIEVPKPKGKSKCSHGGILDGTSFIEAQGGINKDSGYTILSPHAALHLAAARLGIEHTKFYFDEIRKDIKDVKFNRFLQIEIDNATLNSLGNIPCSSSNLRIERSILYSVLFISFLLRLFK